jgi:hypothetical protein
MLETQCQQSKPKLGPTADRCGTNSRSSIMRNQVGNSSTSKLNTLDLGQLVLCLFCGNAVDGEAALGIVDETERLASLFNANNVHEAGGEVGIGANLGVDGDEALHDDRLDFTTVESILETIAKEDDQRHAVS